MESVGASFLSAAPEVTLVNCFRRPYDHAVAAARTCYSGAGIVTAEQVAGDNAPDEDARARARQRRDALAASIFQAGHHTVFQHAHFQFALANVSRHFTWSFLHSHPFYNSEQVSQRYVAVQEGTMPCRPLPARRWPPTARRFRRSWMLYPALPGAGKAGGRGLLPAFPRARATGAVAVGGE